MPDWRATEKFFVDAGIKWKDKPADYLALEKWEQRVKDPRSKTFYQDHRTPEITYPIITTTSIMRVMTRDGEFLVSCQKWLGVTRLLNPDPINMDWFEMHMEPKFDTRTVMDPKNPGHTIDEYIGVNSWLTHYVLPYTPDNAKKLIDMGDPEQPPSYVVKDTRRNVHPREVLTPEHFRYESFEKLLNPSLPTPSNAGPTPPLSTIPQVANIPVTTQTTVGEYREGKMKGKQAQEQDVKQ